MFVRSPSATSASASVAASLGTGALRPSVRLPGSRGSRSGGFDRRPVRDRPLRPGRHHRGRHRQRGSTPAFHRAWPSCAALADSRAPSRSPALSAPVVTRGSRSGDEQGDDDPRRRLVDREADDRDGDEHDVHRVAELTQRDDPERRRLLARDCVRPMLRQTICGLACTEPARRVRPERGSDVDRRERNGGTASPCIYRVHPATLTRSTLTAGGDSGRRRGQATEGQKLEGQDSIAHQTDAGSRRLADPTEVSPSPIAVREQRRACHDLRHRMRSNLVADDGRRREPPKAPVLGVETLGLKGIAVQLPRQPRRPNRVVGSARARQERTRS